MRKDTDRNYTEYLYELLHSYIELVEYQEGKIDEFKTKVNSKDSKLYRLDQEDKKLGTHNLKILELKKEMKIYDVYIILHPIIGSFLYKTKMQEIDSEISLLQQMDENIKNNSISLIKSLK